MLFGPSASGRTADQKRASVDPYWLGPFFAGLSVSEERHFPVPEFAYGECIPVGEGACPWPARVENVDHLCTQPDRPRNAVCPESPGSVAVG